MEQSKASMRRPTESELKHLRLLAKDFPDLPSVRGEIIRKKMLLSLPKGTEYFFSDLHGEDKAFIRLLRGGSGNVRNKIGQVFDKLLSSREQDQLAILIYNPERILEEVSRNQQMTDEWIRVMIYRLVTLLRFIVVKYSLQHVRAKTDPAYADIVMELLYSSSRHDDADANYDAIINAVVSSGDSQAFISVICDLIQNVIVDTLHIIGDIYDRGPGAHRIVEELISFPDVDIQWGNHDVVWMGAAAGSDACIANVVRIAVSYNGFDFLEDGYAINLRPLFSFASTVYADDPCTRFTIKSLDENTYDQVDPHLAAKMHKAISIIQFKLEGQLVKRHPEYDMADRSVLEKIDFTRMVYLDGGKEYPLIDTNFPTVDPADPLKLSLEEEQLMLSLRASFAHGEALRRHINYLYTVGGTYKSINGNLLFHGCIPMTADGEFETALYLKRPLKGKELMDETYREARRAWYRPVGSPERNNALDLMYYLWCGPKSPMFGKSKMATFEGMFIEDKALRKEHYNPYYKLSERVEICEKILAEFGLDPRNSHIINGHVPVKIKDGETPVKANGKLFVIDGGISKAYQPKTGIAGYTMIFNSNSLALVEHSRFEDIEKDSGNYMPQIQVVEYMPRRLRVQDTNAGALLQNQIDDLELLAYSYRMGWIRSQMKGIQA